MFGDHIEGELMRMGEVLSLDSYDQKGLMVVHLIHLLEQRKEKEEEEKEAKEED